jgi:hypothetical protein
MVTGVFAGLVPMMRMTMATTYLFADFVKLVE